MSYEITIVNLKRDEHYSECLANFTYSSIKRVQHAAPQNEFNVQLHKTSSTYSSTKRVQQVQNMVNHKLSCLLLLVLIAGLQESTFLLLVAIAGLSNDTSFFFPLSSVCFLALRFMSFPLSLALLASLFPFSLAATSGFPLAMGNSELMGSGWYVLPALPADLDLYMYNK
jgi:hypothetical protein